MHSTRNGSFFLKDGRMLRKKWLAGAESVSPNTYTCREDKVG